MQIRDRLENPSWEKDISAKVVNKYKKVKFRRNIITTILFTSSIIVFAIFLGKYLNQNLILPIPFFQSENQTDLIVENFLDIFTDDLIPLNELEDLLN